MAGGNENRINAGNELIDIIKSENFSALDSKTKSQVIDVISGEKQRAGGWLGRIFGTNPDSIATYIGFFLTVALIAVLIWTVSTTKDADGQVNMDIVNTIVPLITLSVGYTFGKNGG